MSLVRFVILLFVMLLLGACAIAPRQAVVQPKEQWLYRVLYEGSPVGIYDNIGSRGGAWFYVTGRGAPSLRCRVEWYTKNDLLGPETWLRLQFYRVDPIGQEYLLAAYARDVKMLRAGFYAESSAVHSRTNAEFIHYCRGTADILRDDLQNLKIYQDLNQIFFELSGSDGHPRKPQLPYRWQ